jgi:spermidine synthase
VFLEVPINDMSESRDRKELSAPVLVLLLYFLSGATALVYEVVWSRMLMHVFGSTAVALGTVLAAFMAGLAMGGWLIGKAADKSRNCLRLYAYLEIGLGLAALVSHILLSRIGPAHLALHDVFGFSGFVFGVMRFLLAFSLIMAPTVLMGATFPVLARFLVNRRSKVGINLSTLYATNTFGAVSGVLITGFYLIGTFGVHIPVYGAVAANILIGCIAWLASLRIGDSTPAEPASIPMPGTDQSSSEVSLDPLMFRIILVGLGISGFTSFAYEIYWTRSLVFILGNSTYALTTMLSAFLSGIAIGGYLVRFVLRYMVDRVVTFGFIQVLIGVFSALALPLLFFISDPQTLNAYLLDSSSHVSTLIFTSFGVSFLLMLIPATLIGATFPLAGQIVVKDLHSTGAFVGKIYAINTLGNVLGALLPGFILLSLLGIQKGILAMALLNVTLGFVVLFRSMARGRRHPAWRYALSLILLVTMLAISRAPLQFQFPSDGEQDYFKTTFYREGPLATTKVYMNPRTMEKHMSVDGIVIGGTGFVEFKQLLLAHLPKLLVDDVSTELSVGMGSGILAGESARYPGVESITAVEIEPGVVEGAERFARENHGVLENPRVKIEIDDIGNFLRTTSNRYQVITADEKTADSFASNGFSYSLEYYDLLKDHLAPGGLAAQWVPATLPTRQLIMVLKTFTESFPFVQLWYFLPAQKKGPFNSILIGSNERIELDYNHIQREFNENPEAFSSLVPYGLTSAASVLPHFIADERTLRPAVADALVNSLEHPRYEFFYPWEYAIDRQKQIVANHRFIRELKLKGRAGFIADLEIDERNKPRFLKTLAAEDSYLLGFEQFQTGLSLLDQYRLFDAILAMAPWNDSLRARIYSQYLHIASTRSNPSERARLLKKANQLYETGASQQ